MKLLIADDEPLARERLRRLLEETAEVQIIGEAGSGREALELAGAHHPDVVLLDIRMPDMDGLEAARHLSAMEHPPAVIFTTAYDSHALAAFETQAVAYLLKPIRRENLQQALAKAQKVNRAQLTRLGQAAQAPQGRTHLAAGMRGHVQMIPVGDILYFQADQKYVTVRHRQGQTLIEEPLKDLEAEFAGRFVRIHRNALVALEHIESLLRDANGRNLIRLRGCPETLEVSRRHLPGLRQHLNL